MSKEVRALERIAIAEMGIPGFTLIIRAGTAAFWVSKHTWLRARSAVVGCGIGNNGGSLAWLKIHTIPAQVPHHTVFPAS